MIASLCSDRYSSRGMGRRAMVSAWMTLLLLLSWTESGQAFTARIQLVKRLWGIGEVRVVHGSKSRALERFSTPHEVKAVEISPDQRLAFVWHSGERPSLRLSIYDLQRETRLVEFSPGFGGELHFTPHGNIVHTWGCGSNCHSFRVYDAHGRVVVDGGSAGVEVSPDRTSLLTFPSFIGAGEPLGMYDLETGKHTVAWRAPRNGLFVVDSIAWRSAGVVEVRVTTSTGRTRSISLRTRISRPSKN